MPRFEDIIQSQVKRFIGMIDEQKGKKFNPFDLTNLTIASIVTKSVTGVWYGPHDHDDAPFLRLVKSVARMFEIMGPAGLLSRIPGFSAVPSSTRSQLRSHCRELLDFIDEAIENHKVGFDPEKPANDFIGCYLKVMAESSAQVTSYSKVIASKFHFTLGSIEI